MKKIDILEQWYNQAKIDSSPLNIKPKLNRDVVEKIYSVFIRAFGSSFFTIQLRQEKSLEKTNWLFGLLADNTNSIEYLLDLSNLLDYLESLGSEIKKEFNDLKSNPRNLRSFFFELYIYKLLDQSKISNKKKPIIGKQPVEGVLQIKERIFLFECRKVFAPNISQLDILSRIATDFGLFSENIKNPLAMICTITLKPPVKPSHRDHYRTIISQFFNRLNSSDPPSSIDQVVDDSFGIFRTMEYDLTKLKEITDLNAHNILFYTEPSYVLASSGIVQFSPKVRYSFPISQEVIYKKLEDVIKEKRKQHLHSPIENKIIFIDSETLSELQMGLFQQEDMFNLRTVIEIHKKIIPNTILCITRRSYLNGLSSISVDVICPVQLDEYAKIIGDLFSSLRSRIRISLIQ